VITQKKPLQLNNTLLLLVFLMLCNAIIYGQFKNFGTKAKYKPEPNFNYSVYAYYDIIRESGVGFQYQVGNRWNLDASVYLINKQYSLSGTISQWDYYDLTGYGFSFKPKYLISKMNRFYIGANLAIEALHHDKTWVEYTLGKGDRLYNLEEAKGFAYTLGFTLGNRSTYKRLLIEPFFGMGYVISNLSSKSYARTTGGAIQYYTQPVVVGNHNYFQLNLGIKFGYSFKKNKANEGIDKKFDEVYIPMSSQLNTYFKTLDLRNKHTPKFLKKAFIRYKTLNRNALRAYRHNYQDTARFYKNMDYIFNGIDEFINKAKQ
jgi:hypothetical protein